MNDNPNTKTYQRRAVRLGEAFRLRLQLQSIEEIIGDVDRRAPDHLVDSALVSAFSLCRREIDCLKKQIAGCEAAMVRIRSAMTDRPHYDPDVSSAALTHSNHNADRASGEHEGTSHGD